MSSDIENQADLDGSWTQACARETGVSESSVIEVVGWYEENFADGPKGSIGDVALSKLFRWLLLKKEKRMAIKAAAYALRLDEEIGFQKPADIARDEGCERENVRKIVSEFQRYMGLEARVEQRGDESKRKMSETRRGQLERYSGVCMTLKPGKSKGQTE